MKIPDGLTASLLVYIISYICLRIFLFKRSENKKSNPSSQANHDNIDFLDYSNSDFSNDYEDLDDEDWDFDCDYD